MTHVEQLPIPGSARAPFAWWARLVGEPQYKPNLTLRGMASLEVAV